VAQEEGRYAFGVTFWVALALAAIALVPALPSQPAPASTAPRRASAVVKP
jgi:hypothetical protein